MKLFRMLRKIALLSAASTGFLFLFSVIVNGVMISAYSKQLKSAINEVDAARVGLVLGASVYASRKPSGILLERLDTAIELYRHHKVEKLLLSGDNSKKYYDEVNVMKDYALRHGVKANDIFIDHNGLRTLDSIFRSKLIFKVRRLVLVTQKFHLARALFLADQVGLQAVGLAADSGRVKVGVKMKLREFIARIAAFLDIYVFSTQPKFLGKQTPLIGNGQVTWNKDN